jgi:hypothetical protein
MVEVNPLPSQSRASQAASQPASAPEPEPYSEPSAGVDRALEALASAAGPRGGSRLELDGVVLAVPWRSQLVDRTGSTPTTDGSAAIGMILEAYGVTVATADLQALAERWQGKWGPTDPVRLETLIRIGDRGSLHPLGPGLGSGSGDWSAELARDHIRRGYPVLGLFRPSLLRVDEAEANRPDRYVVLMGFEGDYLLYHDPAVPDGAARRIHSSELDHAWANAALPRIGVAFGFGTNIIGLLNGSETLVVAATPAPTTVSPPPTFTPPESVPETGRTLPFGGGLNPALIAFLAALAGGVGFVFARLLR